MINTQIFESPVGRLLIAAAGNAITGISICNEKHCETPSDLTEEAVRQLSEYFKGKRKVFSLPLAPNGTPFQKKVWNEFMKIPYGKTCSYKDIAEKVGGKGYSRAVGQAANKNPILIVIPCHRIVGANGKLTGFACGLNIKKNLLTAEEKK